MTKWTPAERRYLSRFICGRCEMPFHRTGCGAIYQRCAESDRQARVLQALAARRPRNRTQDRGS